MIRAYRVYNRPRIDFRNFCIERGYEYCDCPLTRVYKLISINHNFKARIKEFK